MDYDKDSILKQLKVITNTSGPVIPAKTSIIKTMKSLFTNENGANHNDVDLIYDKNGSLLEKKKYFTINAITKKLITESVSSTPSTAFRLDLHSIVMNSNHSKFSLTRKGRPVIVELLYPNANNNITVKITLDGINSNIYEIGLDSDQFINNFGVSIIKSIDKLIEKNTNVEISNSDDNLSFGLNSNDIGPNSTTNGYALESALYGLKNMCARFEADEDTGDESTDNTQSEFGAEDFSANPDQANDSAGMGGMGDFDMGDKTKETQESEDENNDTIDFKEYAKDRFDTTEGATLDKIAKIVSNCLANDLKNHTQGISYSADDLYKGTDGIRSEGFDSIINAFLEYYDKFEGMQKIEDLDKLTEYIDNHDADINEFNKFIAGAYPDIYGQNAQENVDMDSLELPTDPFSQENIENKPKSTESGDINTFMDNTENLVNPDQEQDQEQSDTEQVNPELWPNL